MLLVGCSHCIQPLAFPCSEVYNLFDDVMVLSEGHIIYHGAREEVRSSSGWQRGGGVLARR